MKRILSVLLCMALCAGSFVFSVDALDLNPKDPTDFPDKFGGYGQVVYSIDGATDTQSVRAGKAVELRSDYAMQQYGDRILVGWQTESGTAYYYDNTDFWRPDGKTDLTLQDGETCTLVPIWCPISIRKEEVFSFTNSERVFNADVDGYLFTREHFLRILPNWLCTFALTPFAPIASLFCTFYLFVWPTFSFYGSCCGFPISVMLQHNGKIDLLSGQGVSNVCELEPDDTVQSTINYYNIHAVAAMPTNHIGLVPGTDEYQKQLRALYDTLERGNAAYFELYGDGQHLLRTFLTHPLDLIRNFNDLTAHGVLLTGAYTDANGNHILIMYDSNSMRYADGSCSVMYINPDFTQICSSYAWGLEDDALNGFSWNDDFGQFDAFKTEGLSNPFAWHVRFLRNIPSLMRQIIPMYKAK